MCTTCAVTHFNQIPWGCACVSPRDWCLNLMMVSEPYGASSFRATPYPWCRKHPNHSKQVWVHHVSFGSKIVCTSCAFSFQKAMQHQLSESVSLPPRNRNQKQAFQAPAKPSQFSPFEFWRLQFGLSRFSQWRSTLCRIWIVSVKHVVSAQRSFQHLPRNAQKWALIYIIDYIHNYTYITLSNTNRLWCDIFFYI